MKIKILLVFIAVAITFGQAASQAGTTSGNFAKIPLWASSISKMNTGGSYAKGVEALYYNPAGIVGTSEVGLAVREHIADIRSNIIALTFQFDNSAIGIQMSYNDIGDIQQTTWEDQDGQNHSTFTVSQMVLGLSYASQLTDRIKGGITFKSITESVLSTSASAIAIDAGIQYEFNNAFSLGVALKNIGTKMEFSGDGLNSTTKIPGDGNNPTYETRPDVSSAHLPTSFEVGMTYHHKLDENSYFETSSTVTVDNAAQNQAFASFDYGYDMFNVRGGYDFTSSWNKETLYDYTAGFGLNVEMDTNTSLSIDYAYAHSSNKFKDLNMFSLRLSF